MFKSVTSGTCAMNGKHTPGSDLEAECPLLRARQRALEASRTRLEKASKGQVALPRAKRRGEPA